jgi:hypothetical protein
VTCLGKTLIVLRRQRLFETLPQRYDYIVHCEVSESQRHSKAAVEQCLKGMIGEYAARAQLATATHDALPLSESARTDRFALGEILPPSRVHTPAYWTASPKIAIIVSRMVHSPRR